MTEPSLARLLCEHLASGAAAGSERSLESTLAGLVAGGRAAWPTVDIPAQLFIPFVARRLPPERPVEDSLAALRVADLYLACGCANRISGAAAAFEESFVPQMRRAVVQAQLPGVSVDEVVQMVRERLLVGDAERPPRIEQYTGRGDIRSWLRVVAVRQALVRLRKAGKERPSDDQRIQALLEEDSDPELAYLKAIYHDAFEQAFAAAMERLEPKERNLLRYHYLDGLSLERVALLYRVHRATGARWLAAARTKLFAETQAALREQIQVSDTEFRSLVRLLRSQLDLSVRRFLNDD